MIQRIKEDISYPPIQIIKTNIEEAFGFFQNPVILSHEKTIYVWRRPDFSKTETKVDILIDFKYKVTIPVGNTQLKAIDR